MRTAARLTGRSPARGPRPRLLPSSRGDRWALAAVAVLIAAAALTGGLLGLAGRPVHAPAAPLFGHVLPHAGPGTPAAIAVALAVIRWGPPLAARLPWRRLLATAYAASVAWTFALALIDGPERGIADRLTTRFEYLAEVPRVTDILTMLRTFDSHIVEGSPDPWTTHVAGHPPGALLVFVALDRLGLHGGAWAAIACALIGCLATAAVAGTLRALHDEPAARAALPYLVLFPGAVWVGVSADGLFAGVAALAIALLAAGLARSSPWRLIAAGAALAGCAYLSYGLILLALPAAAVALTHLAGRHATPLGRTNVLSLLTWVLAGMAAVVVAMTLLGFSWWDGYHLVRERYYQGLASERPYGYWVWANLAAFCLSTGPIAAPVLRRIAGSSLLAGSLAVPFHRLTTRGAGVHGRVALLVAAFCAAALAADLSGMSKAEVERIWLPFAVWLPAAAVVLPGRDRRWWLTAQAVTALLVNHLVLTAW
ncbi:membrane protein [Paractinoplanes deccanensis]|uniref:Membrane protein n=1 Tax=Paractinoplanes deccanensis TaxID=113561 RepID=A0ABQ3XWX2_9ACTN|nr:hypothetical protein [Actinoplanes deccanensis]GID72216.1 membrane protein [Actinoplanes deccanensis]